MRQQEAARGQIEKVRGKKKSHQVGSKSVEALSKPNDSAASLRTSLTLPKPSLPLSMDVSLQAVSSRLTLIIPPSTCIPPCACHSPSSLYSQVSPSRPFVPPPLYCPFRVSLGHGKSQNSPLLKITCEF